MSSTAVEPSYPPRRSGSTPRLTIDHRMYPHIFEDIIQHVSSSRRTLFALCCTCCNVKEVIDPYLVTHLVVSEEGDQFGSSIEVRPYGCGEWFPPWAVGGTHYYDKDADEYDYQFEGENEGENEDVDGNKANDEDAEWDANEEGDWYEDDIEDEDEDEDEASCGSSDQHSTSATFPAANSSILTAQSTIALKDDTNERHAQDDAQDDAQDHAQDDAQDVYYFDKSDNCSDSDSTYVPSESDSGSFLETIELWLDYGLENLPGPKVLDVVGPVRSDWLEGMDCSLLRTVRFRPLPLPLQCCWYGGRHPTAATVSIVLADTVVEFADWEKSTAGQNATVRLETPHTGVKHLVCNIRFRGDNHLVGGVIVPPQLSQLSTLEEVVFVFQRDKHPAPYITSCPETTRMFGDTVGIIAAELPRVRATFVGLENITPRWVYGDPLDGHSTFYLCLEIDRVLRSLHPSWSANDLRVAHSRVSFMSLNDYRIKIGHKQFRLHTIE